MKAILKESCRAEARNPSGANNANPAPAYTDALRTVRRLSWVSIRSIVFIRPPVGFRGSRKYADRGRVSTPPARCNTSCRLHPLFRAPSSLIQKDGQDENDANGNVLPEWLHTGNH